MTLATLLLFLIPWRDTSFTKIQYTSQLLPNVPLLIHSAWDGKLSGSCPTCITHVHLKACSRKPLYTLLQATPSSVGVHTVDLRSSPWHASSGPKGAVVCLRTCQLAQRTGTLSSEHLHFSGRLPSDWLVLIINFPTCNGLIRLL